MPSQLKGAFRDCKWCHGTGCMGCDAEREKAFERSKRPILQYTPEDMKDPTLGPLIRDAIGAKALEKAFGFDGGGMDEVRANCAMVTLLQAIRENSHTNASNNDGE